MCQARIVAQYDNKRYVYSRLFAIDRDGSNMKTLTKTNNERSLQSTTFGGAIIDWQAEGKPGRVLMTRNFVPETDIGRVKQQNDEGLGVEAVDLSNLNRSTVEKGRRQASGYISDGRGRVRMMGYLDRTGTGYIQGALSYQYRRRDSDDWQPFAKAKLNAQSFSGFVPIAIDPDENVVYGFDDVGGFRALVKETLDEARTRTIVLARNDVDIDSLVRIGRQRRVVGVSYATERRQTEFFDAKLKALTASLSRALPGNPALEVIDASADEGKLLVLASSDTHPGTIYRFDKATKQLAEVMQMRPAIAGMKTGEMRPIRFSGPDGVEIPGYLTLPPGSTGKNLPAIVMPHGGPSARDEWGFDWLAQYFAARGFAVLQPNFRGSAGYGKAWFEKNGFQSWKTAVGDVNAGGRWLVSQGIAAPSKLAIFGWSYGGYAALQSSALDPELFKAIVAVAPVTDLAMLRAEAKDYSDYMLQRDFIGDGPHIREGSPAQNAASIRAPVLLWHGDKDDNVDVEESRLMVRKLREAGKPVTYNEFPGLDNYLYSDEARARLLGESDAFIRNALGIR